MKLKTLAAAGITAAFLLTLTACGGNAGGPSSITAPTTAATSQAPKPYDVYKAAFDKTAAEKSYQYTLNMKAVVEFTGISTEMLVKEDVALIDNGDSGEMLSDSVTTVMGQESRNISYFKDGVMYSSTADIKTKRASSWADFQSLFEDNSDPMFIAGEKDIKNLTTAEKDGGTAFTFTLSADAVREEMDEMVNSMGMEVSDGTITIADPEISCFAGSDGYLSDYTAAIQVTAKAPVTDEATGETTEMTLTFKFDISIDFKAFGSKVAVTPPADLDTYEDRTLSVDDLSAADIQNIVELLHDENGDPVENFDEVYRTLEMAYGVDVMRQITGG